MKNKEDVINEIKAQFAKLEIQIADISTYPATKGYHKDNKFDVVIVAGYIPGKACLMTCDINVRRDNINKSGCRFVIDGEVPSREVYEKYVEPLPRRPVGSESPNSCFMINDYYTSLTGGISQNISQGFKFFQQFINKCLTIVLSKFTEHVHLWYVPEHSDVLLELEKNFGRYNNRNYETFNAKVFCQIPNEIFSEDQSF
jgi:hypothetical protein